MQSLWFKHALLPTGWADAVRIVIADGRIVSIACGAVPESGDARHASALPGLPNLHSHCFQRLMAGFAEARSGPAHDDFWSWRALMYRLVGGLNPDDLAAIAAMAFVEMLEAGFTRVGEFHYLHHQPSGTPYANRGEMAAAIASSAAETGIALTLLPVFYAHGGFGGAAPDAGQRRFVNDVDGFGCLLDSSRRALADLPGAVVGVAPHSLRAVTPGELELLGAICRDGPIHIHVAEQEKEVADCLAWSGQRPVAWLLDHAAVDQRWCLIHATHVDAEELARVAASEAVVGLCPVTEANLGDGIFPADAFANAGGRFGIGSDSNVRIDAAEELRLLEYGQRLSLRRRTVLAGASGSTGRTLVAAALEGGGQALGSGGALAEGAPADLIALSHDPLAQRDDVLDRWIFAGGGPRVESVWRAGQQVVSEGRHRARDAIAERFTRTAARLLHA